MQYSNLTEYLSESALRKKLGGIWAGKTSPDDPRYAAAGFLPVAYQELQKYQKHDSTTAYIDNGLVSIPAVDISLPEAKENAVGEIYQAVNEAENEGADIVYKNNTYKFSLSPEAKALYEANKNKKDGKTRRWITKSGYPLSIPDSDFDEIHAQIGEKIDGIYAKYAVDYDRIMQAESVEAIRLITQG